MKMFNLKTVFKCNDIFTILFLKLTQDCILLVFISLDFVLLVICKQYNCVCVCVCVCVLSRVQLFATPWTIAHQALLSMNFPRQEYWSGLPCSPPGDLPDPEIEPTSFASPVLAGIFFTTMPPGKPQYNCDQALTIS